MSTTQMTAQRMGQKRIKPARHRCTDVELARLVNADHAPSDQEADK